MAKPILTYFALGDSYTVGTGVGESECFPMQLAALLGAGRQPVSLEELVAVNGWTTGDLLKALADKPVLATADFVTLLIGVNNQYQQRSLEEYRREFSALLENSVRLAGNRPPRVFVLSIPDYSVTPFARDKNPAKIASEIDLFNEANYAIAIAAGARYLNITPESRKAAGDPSLVAADGLHFSGREYAVWADMLAPLVMDVLGE